MPAPPDFSTNLSHTPPLPLAGERREGEDGTPEQAPLPLAPCQGSTSSSDASSPTPIQSDERPSLA